MAEIKPTTKKETKPKDELKDNFDFEIIEEGGKTKVKLTFTKEKLREGEVILHQKGWELYSPEDAEAILRQHKEQYKVLKERRMKNVVLTNEELRIKKAMENIAKKREYEEAAKKMGSSTDEYLDKQAQTLEQVKGFLDLWQDVCTALQKKAGGDYIG